MSPTSIEIVKSEEELPIPVEWRAAFCRIAEAFTSGDYRIEGIPGVAPVSRSMAKWISDYIRDYGCTLISLPEECWESSTYLWMEGYWEVLIDLFTLEEGRSDLVMFAHVHEHGASYRFEVTSVHVP